MNSDKKAYASVFYGLTSLKAQIDLVLILVASFILFTTVIGLNVLDPTNVAWLYGGPNSDPLQAYLGWEFFRDDDWKIPLGSNFNFGLLPNNSIAYSDSIPIAAIVFKVFKGLLPSHFQYFGFWLLICFLLQGMFSLLIIRHFSSNKLANALLTLPLLCLPFWLERMTVHIALSSHFLVIAAIYLLLQRREKYKTQRIKWALLLVFSCMIHAYLFFMVFIIYLGYVVWVFLKNCALRKTIFLSEGLSLITIVLVSKLVVGYSVGTPTGLETNFWGVYRWNILSPLYPAGWSRALKFLPERSGNFDTFTFLGLGLILLISLSSVTFLYSSPRTRPKSSAEVILFLSPFLLLSIFAVTNRIAIGDLRFNIPFPQYLVETFSIFRASARMVWPSLYLLIIASIKRILSRPKASSWIIASLAVVVVQVVDSYAGLSLVRERFTVNQTQPTYSKEWETLSKEYNELRVLFSSRQDVSGWSEVADIASNFGFKTNCAYLARTDKITIDLMYTKTLHELKSGRFDSKTIYALLTDDEYKLAKNSRGPNDIIEEIDGLKFLFPNLAALHTN